MPHGRHRHSPPLHRMLPPLTVAGCAAALAAASLLVADTGALRVITAATALTACAGAALARTWDRSAGRRVAELTTARTRDEWRSDERIAELETELEEAREIRGRLEKKLRVKRGELADLRTEYAALLRRYATAETGRARALESRHRRELGAAPQQLALAGASPVGPAAFLKADQALRDLSRNVAGQQAQRTVEDARRREAAAPAEDEPQGRHAAESADATHSRAAAADRSSVGLPVREHRLVPAVAAAVLPYSQPQRPAGSPHPDGHRAIGGFDFFGTQKTGEPSAAASSVPDVRGPNVPGHPAHSAPGAVDDFRAFTGRGATADLADLADVVGEEAYAEHEQAGAAEVIDLTAHDDTEEIVLTELHAQA